MSDGLFDLYDRRRLRIFPLPRVEALKCPGEAALIRWLVSCGAPADLRLHGRSRGADADPVLFFLWSASFDPVPEGELIPAWVLEER